jgi:hypothetical protein
MGIGDWKRLLLMKEDNSAQIEQLQGRLNQQSMLTEKVIHLYDLETKISVDCDERQENKSNCSTVILDESRPNRFSGDLAEVADWVTKKQHAGVDKTIAVPEDTDIDELLKRKISDRPEGSEKPQETSAEDSTENAREQLRRLKRELQVELAQGRLEKSKNPSPVYKYSKEKISLATVGAGVIALFMGWMGWLSLKVIAQGETLAAIVATVETLKK